MKKIIQAVSISALIVASVLGGAGLFANTAHADAKSEILGGVSQAGGSQNTTNLQSSVTSIVNLILYALGIICVVVIVIAGIMFSTSAGDPGKAKKAKDAILYAVIGLVVATLSYAIVKFVVDGI